MFHEKKSIDEISHILERTKYGIIAKLERLGLIKQVLPVLKCAMLVILGIIAH
jgi:hypothetical protein